MTKVESRTQAAAEQAGLGEAVPDDRWSTAQRFERDYWTNIKRNGFRGLSAEQFAHRHPIVQAWSLAYLEHDFDWYRDKTLVDVGCGPMGPLAGLTAAHKYGVDPLLSTYEDLWDLESHACTYLAERGEAISLDDGVADLVICLNMLDHVQLPRQVLAEIRRILRSDGELYLAVNLKDQDDRCHPHGFDLAAIAQLLRQSGFQIQKAHVMSPFSATDRPFHFTSVCKIAETFSEQIPELRPANGAGGLQTVDPTIRVEQLQAALSACRAELGETHELVRRYESGRFLGTMAKITDLRTRLRNWVKRTE